MDWKEGLLNDGIRDLTVGRYYCVPCRLNMKMTESRAIRKGRQLSNKFDGISALDKRIRVLPVAVQIGLLRERQKGMKP
jgi:hypothetical protein